MEQKYWLGRKRAARTMADKASNSEARLVHYELAGRYAVKAMNAAAPTVRTEPAEPLPLGIAAVPVDPDRPRCPGSAYVGDGITPKLDPRLP